MAFPALRSRTVRHSEQRQLLHSVVPFPVKETWTHEFCCLPSRKQEISPTASELEALRRIGHGKQKIKFENKNTPHSKFCERIEEVYPQLKMVGGYTLHRAKSGGIGRPLVQLVSRWYNVKSLREEITTSACIYIRPVQANLDLSLKKVCILQPYIRAVILHYPIFQLLFIVSLPSVS